MELTNINNYFDRIYVITLDREMERQEHIIKNLQDLHYELFFGVDKKSLVLDDLIYDGIYDEEQAIEYHRYDKPMNTGLIGRSWSHRLVYEDMLEKNYERVLILEDESVPNREGIDLLESRINNLPADWELLYLNCDVNLSRNPATFFKEIGLHIRRLLGKVKWSHTMIRNMHARKYAENILKAGMHGCSDAYAINRRAAEKLVRLQTPICLPANDLLAHACTNNIVKGYVFQPNAFKQHAFLQAKTLIS